MTRLGLGFGGLPASPRGIARREDHPDRGGRLKGEAAMAPQVRQQGRLLGGDGGDSPLTSGPFRVVEVEEEERNIR